MGWCTVTNLVPSGKVASTWISGISHIRQQLHRMSISSDRRTSPGGECLHRACRLGHATVGIGWVRVEFDSAGSAVNEYDGA